MVNSHFAHFSLQQERGRDGVSCYDPKYSQHRKPCSTWDVLFHDLRLCPALVPRCGLLASSGAELYVSDLDRTRLTEARDRWEARIVSSEALLPMELDVFAPCAMGGVIDSSTAHFIQAKVIAGAANNQLARLEDGDVLHGRSIWYLPDFLVNAGGVIAVAREYLGTATESSVRQEIRRISMRVEELVRATKETGRPSARIALDWARALAATGNAESAASGTCGERSSG